uniref:Uncharacterized protein n=1 Tax=Arundo donax TaxID=35708 RepID=A0A0A9EX75_ARUDO
MSLHSLKTSMCNISSLDLFTVTICYPL